MGYSVCRGWYKDHERRTCDRCDKCPVCQGVRLTRITSFLKPYGSTFGTTAGLVGRFCAECVPAVREVLARHGEEQRAAMLRLEAAHKIGQLA